MSASFLMSGNAQEYLTGFNGGLPEQESLKLRDEVTATLPFSMILPPKESILMLQDGKPEMLQLALVSRKCQ